MCQRGTRAVCVRAESESSEQLNLTFFTKVLDGMLELYWGRTPSAVTATQHLQSLQPDTPLTYDHVAFRSFGVDGCGISAVEKFFLENGYTKRDVLRFEKKKLTAYWYAPPSTEGKAMLPRVFVSELCVDELSDTAQKIITKYTSQAKHNVDHAAMSGVLGVPPWPTPSREDYLQLAEESEYAAWTLVNGFILNHTTISVHALEGAVQGIDAVNEEITGLENVVLNGNGKLNISPDGLLLQSSTTADNITVTFAGGETEELPGAYIEFAERRVLPEFAGLPISQIAEEHRRDGFEVGNADKIFESTNQGAAKL
ncbi:hypothetical protein CYMTET_16444 [Cymbomonas tetramitiformis]|uniref:2-oxoadipate dioxygenase/decarboxylase n=1 Tax=Cymbomonas tetramitiformis TaxID=36881 RepID=A0AAE0GCB9_9CHLO|nr:hypothetical protein CYMTET_16444 [Cymbomonas tetramitiformis]